MIVLREFIVVFLSVLFFFVAPAYAQNQTQNQTQTQPKTWLTYDDPILGISIQHPEGWEVTEEPNTITFRHYNEYNGSKNVVAIAAVMTESRPEDIETSEDFMKSLMNEFRGDMTSEIHGINGTMVIDGKSTYKVDYSSRDEDADILKNGYFMVDKVNNMMYYLSFNVKEDKYAEYQPIFDKMANSLKVL
jgi:hypothetical protein